VHGKIIKRMLTDQHAPININVPLILKMRGDYFFLRANYFMGHFEGYFEGAKTFLTLYLGVKKVEAPYKYSKK
jgi:hypothetical protein